MRNPDSRRSALLAASALLLAATLMSSVLSADEGTFLPQSLDVVEAAREYVLGESWALSAGGLLDVEPVRAIYEHGLVYVHFKVFYNGIHVQRAGLYLVADSATRRVLSVERELKTLDGVALEPDLFPTAAFDRVLGWQWIFVDEPELIYYTAADGVPRLAWQSTLSRVGDNGETTVEGLHVDAVSGELLGRYDAQGDPGLAVGLFTKAAPAAPTLSIEFLRCYGSNLLSWNAVSGAVKYKVFYSSNTSASTATLYKVVNYVTYTGANVGPLQSPLYFWVKACNSSNQCSAFSNRVKARYYPGCA